MTYNDVATILKISGSTISIAEKWLRGAPFDEVKNVFTMDRLQQVVKEVLTDENILPVELVNADRLTPDDILEHYRKDYPEHKKKTPKSFGEVESARYQDHQKVLLLLVRRLINRLEPNLSPAFIRSPTDSRKNRRTSRQSPGPKISTAPQIKLLSDRDLSNDLELDDTDGTKILRDYLRQHLNSGSYSWLVNNKERGIPKWKRLRDEEIYRCSKLLRSIDREALRVTNKPMNKPDSTDYLGSSTWFSDSIFDTVVEGMYHGLDYEIEPVDNSQFIIRFAAGLIGRAETREEAYAYVDFHKQLKAKYEKSKMVKAINSVRGKRESITGEIREILNKFIVDKHISGNCDYEFCD